MTKKRETHTQFSTRVKMCARPHIFFSLLVLFSFIYWILFFYSLNISKRAEQINVAAEQRHFIGVSILHVVYAVD